MAATVVLSVQNGSSPGSATDSVTGIDLVSADNAYNSLSNRQSYPITVGTNSYEKWLRLKITATPANNLWNFKIWGGGSVDTSTALYFTSNYTTYGTPVNTTSSVANANFTSYTSGNKATWDATTFTNTNVNSYTKYCVFQLQVGATAGPGNWTQQTINYSYDES